MASVEQAIRRSITEGQRLKTPDLLKAAPFVVHSFDDDGMVLLQGSKRSPARIRWKCLEGIPPFLKGKGCVEIATSKSASGKAKHTG